MNLHEIKKILEAPFDLEGWKEILQKIFGVTQLSSSPGEIKLPANDIAQNALKLGEFETQDELLVGLYWVKVHPKIQLERNKVGLRKLLKPIYEQAVDGALVVFEQGAQWRLSFISEVQIFNTQGELTDQKTAPKRFTYLLGQAQKVRVPAKRLDGLQKQKPFPLQALFEAFSVEALNQEFYAGVAEHFYDLVGKEQSEGCLRLPSLQPAENQTTYRNFAVRLIGRIVFCWFLKMKCSDAGVSLLPEALLSSKAVGENPNYYHEVLGRLFFQTLNTPAEQRRSDLPKGAETIPFLNGGLFSPGAEDFYQTDEGLGLSRHLNTLQICDAWFVRFFEFLEQYHFTLDENSLNDAEVSVDPEMLGRIFENLLAEIDPESGESARKATGSFYTPREIVDYMVEESLLHVLQHKTGLSRQKLRLLFEENDEETEDLPFDESETQTLLDALFALKILDPACGSGAFPMGILQKMLVALEKLDPEAEGWIVRQLQPIGNEALKQQIRKKLNAATVEYARKIGIIQHSIFGVDLQPMATGIAQLRCFLTLVVDAQVKDEESNRGIQPLPNLEFKFITADALGKLPKDSGQQDFSRSEQKVERLKNLRKNYFQSTGEEKEAIKTEFLDIQKSMWLDRLAFSEGSDKGSGAKLMEWNPFESKGADWFDPQWMFNVKNGFDLVLGNPPYIQLQKDNGALAKRYQSFGYQTLVRTGDIYALFYERSLELLQPGGNSCLITSNKWMRTGYGERLRGFLAKENPLQLLDLGPGIFTATVDTNILLVQKRPNQNALQALTLQAKSELVGLKNTPLPALPAPSDSAWIILNPQEQRLKEKIEQRGTPLKDWPVQINYGIKTGFNKAFILSTEQRDALIEQDPQSEEILKPILRGKDIQRYSHQWAGLWVINSHNGFVDEKGQKITVVNIEQYPAIKAHLDAHWHKLETRLDQGKTPYNLRNCAYLQAFEEEKVVYSEIVREPQFYFDNESFYAEATAFLMTGTNIKALCGILNSKPFTFFFRNYYAGGGLGSEGFRYKKKFLKEAPIPLITTANQVIFTQIEGLVDAILEKKACGASSVLEEGELDELVFGLYGLSEAEKRMVKGE